MAGPIKDSETDSAESDLQRDQEIGDERRS